MFDASEESILTINWAALEVFDDYGTTQHYYVDTSVFPEPISFKVPAGMGQHFSLPDVVLDTRKIPEGICTKDYRDAYPVILEIKPVNLGDRRTTATA